MEAFELESEPSEPSAQRRSLVLDSDGSFHSGQAASASSTPGGGSSFSAYVNATNTILGAGTLAVPIAMSSAGLVSYELITLFVVAVNFTTVNWLATVSDHLPKGTPRNYEGISRKYLGAAASHVISLVFIFGSLSLCMSYMLFTAQSLAPIVAGWMSPSELPSESELNRLSRILLWALGLGVVLPVGLLRDISKLKFTSTVAIFALAYAAGFIVFCNLEALAVQPRVGNGFQLVNVHSDFFLSLAMTTSNFSCHISAIPIYESLASRNASTMKRVVALALGTSALFYQVVGLTSYCRFGRLEAGKGGNILEVVAESISLLETPLRFALVSVASAGVAFCLAFSMPVVMWALRSVILSYYQAACAAHARSAGLPAEEVSEIENGEPSMLEWYIATCFIMVVILTLATLVPDVQVIMSLGGSLGGTFIAFMYPALFRLTVVKKVRSAREMLRLEHGAELGVIGMSILYGILCLSISLRKVYEEFLESSELEPIATVTSTTATVTLTTTTATELMSVFEI